MSDPSSTETGRNNKYLAQVYHLQSTEASKDLYNEWAASYDNDVNAENYTSPQSTADTVVANTSNLSGEIKILDAGCGTGLVGECLVKSLSAGGAVIIDGNDASQGMLDVAREKGVYRNLDVVDLNGKLESPDESYDVVTCAGTLTKAHVGPKVFNEFARLTKKGGLIVATVHGEIWESHGYKKEVEDLAANGVIDIVSTNEFGIMKGLTKGGIMVVLRKK